MFARSFVLALLLSVASAQKALITFTAARNEKLAVYFGAPDIFPPPTHRKCIDWGASLLSHNRTKRRSPHWRPLVVKQQHPDLRCYVSLISCHLSPAPPPRAHVQWGRRRRGPVTTRRSWTSSSPASPSPWTSSPKTPSSSGMELARSPRHHRGATCQPLPSRPGFPHALNLNSVLTFFLLLACRRLQLRRHEVPQQGVGVRPPQRLRPPARDQLQEPRRGHARRAGAMSERTQHRSLQGHSSGHSSGFARTGE